LNSSFTDFRFNSPFGMVSVMSTWTLNFTGCMFSNISNDALGVFVLSRMKNFILDSCIFNGIYGTSLLISYARDPLLVSNCLFQNLTTPLQGVLKILNGPLSIFNSTFINVSGPITLDYASAMVWNTSFLNSRTSTFKILTESNLTILNVSIINSQKSDRSCVEVMHQ
jgi:hypothetical protein